jgi:regulator of replication initiation timing
MDTIFIWLIAGAAIGLLGIFLVASERELKRKRQELDELKHQLADVPAPGISNASADVFSQEYGASAELMARNKDLLDDVSSLSKKLEASESRLEQLETLRAHLNSKESEITELRWERERLQSELAALKTPSTSSEPPTDEAMQNSQKDAEIGILKEQLEASQAKVRDLESAGESLGDTESRQTAFEELRSRFEANNLQLQNELAAEQEKNKALEASQMRFKAMELRYQELGEVNFQLREENAQLQQKLINQNQLQVERLPRLRQGLEELRSQQAKVSEQNRLIEEEIVAMSQFLDVVPEYAQPEPPNATSYDQANILELTEKESAATGNGDIVERTSFGAPASELHSHHHDDGFDTTNGSSKEAPRHNSVNLTAAVGTQASKELSIQGLTKKRFGIFSAGIGVLVVGGVFAASFLNKDSEQDPSATQGSSTATHIKSQSTAAAPAHEDGRSAEEVVRVAPTIPYASPVESKTKPSEKTNMSIASSNRLSSTVWESYEVIQPTRVFSAPRADSQLIANIEPGTQVNVVDSRDGWLEIRSKHGRPPGFIRKDAAIRIGSN